MIDNQGLLFSKEQFRMCRLQVFNWGTFSGLHNVPISEKGFLVVGRSGTGKSTLLDAFTALLVPLRWIEFNAAARETDRGGKDRNLVTYIRGAWAEQKDGESGEYVTKYLRQGTTWSALALSYKNEAGRTITLVQIFKLLGNANGNSDVKRHFIIFEREFELRELENFEQANLETRKLNQLFPNVIIRSEFRPYCEHFMRLLGIENEMALRLLHKTQSAKNLGDLNIFLRDFMLEKPDTFDVADRLVNEFGELNEAHQSVVTARRQIEVLSPAREKHHQRELMLTELNSLNELNESIYSYRETRRMNLLKDNITSLKIEAEGFKGETVHRQELLDNHKIVLQDLQRRHLELGGDKIEAWENEKRSLEGQREERLRKREQAAAACKELGWSLAQTPQGFAELVGEARKEIEEFEERSKKAQEELLSWHSKKKETEISFTETRKEIKSLESQPSNIPSDMLDMREKIAAAIGISCSSLPFAGELIEVKKDQSSWQGAIERVLRSFALSLLVDENNYPALSNYINNTHLGSRLVYYRTGRAENFIDKQIKNDSLVLKLNIKNDNGDWLKTELRQRFDYACVESVQAFRAADRALTREGQIKHSKVRHEKDDRISIGDKRGWVLGFDNRDKLMLFQKQAQELAEVIAECDKKINSLSDQNIKSISRDRNCQTLSNLEWQEIDVVPLLDRISVIEKNLRETREGNIALKEISLRIEKQNLIITQADNNLRNIKIKHDKALDKIEEYEAKLENIKNDSMIVPLTPNQKTSLDERYAKAAPSNLQTENESVTDNVSLDTIDRVTTSVVQALGNEIEKIKLEIARYEKQIENIFADFKRSWAVDSVDLDATLLSAQDYFSKLTRLETDGLPAHERKFFELLQTQSNQNLAALSTYLYDAKKEIIERMSLVNESLRQVPFNKTENQRTYLHIEANDRQLQDVRDFKQDIQQALSYAWSEDRQNEEARFIALRKMVERLSGQEPEQKRWRDHVLDVRQHVEFIGREIDESGAEIEVYRSGAGKSGGQRQKLATTCLAAALRYQLGGIEHGFPMYAPVILDEAFDKADNEFTAISMEIFKNFGFQMIVATPLRSVMTLEPFIGGACFVDISDRRVSSVLSIKYDDDSQRLNLSVQPDDEDEQ